MGKVYPALDVDSTSELLLALVDDCSPTAVEPRGAATRLFFASDMDRAVATAALHAAGYRTQRVDVDDEDWARRSQEHLAPIIVDGLTIVAPWHLAPGTRHPAPGTIAILPSMGFGTGHHETTRLCLQALQDIDLARKTMLDVGTGSGVLAIAADLLGASAVLGIDNDPDAIQAARDNLALNPAAVHTTFEVADISRGAPPAADVVTANLTGALLARIAGTLFDAVRPGGVLILSGLLEAERDEVRQAFSALTTAGESREAEWTALVLKKA